MTKMNILYSWKGRAKVYSPYNYAEVNARDHGLPQVLSLTHVEPQIVFQFQPRTYKWRQVFMV